MVLRITTWNVNGIRNPFGYQPWRDRRTFDGMFEILEADIVVMQELKIQRKDLRDDMVLVPGWDCYFSLPRHKKGYSGVGIYTRNATCAPIRAEEGLLGVLCPPNSSVPYRDLPSDQHIGGYLTEEQLVALDVDAAALDAEGRCVILEFPAFVILGLYSPANSSGLRDDFRLAFSTALDTRVRNLVRLGKRVVVTGDLNVSRGELDTAGLAERIKKEGLTHEDYVSTPNRRIFNQLIEGGDVHGERDAGRENPVLWDICRGFHPTRKGMYTHWEQKINARPGNYGSRIDFVLCSLDMKSWFCESNIQEGLMGSDHCPVYAVLDDVVDVDGKQTHVVDIMNPPDTFEQGERLREHSLKDVCAFSAKLLPEFDKRRSIRDMFGTKPFWKATPSTQASEDQEALALSESVASLAASNNSQASELGKSDRVPLAQNAFPGTQTSTTTPSPTTSPEKKRRISGPAPAAAKRTKSNASATLAVPGKGQQSLKGFFTSKSQAQNGKEEKDGGESISQDALAIGDPAAEGQTLLSDQICAKTNAATEPTQEVWPSHAASTEQIFERNSTSSVKAIPNPPQTPDQAPSPPEFVDPIVSKESWSKLFSKPIAPRCESHNEPCKTMKTKKPGFNCGREFWMCARPLGPSGDKERNTQWRCPTFIWTSDWNPITGQST